MPSLYPFAFPSFQAAITEIIANPELHNRFKRIQAASSNNRLRIARQNVKDSGQYVIDPFTNLSLDNKKFYKERKAKGTYDIREIIEDNSKQNRIDLEKLDKIKKERAGKNYRFKRKILNLIMIMNSQNLKLNTIKLRN